MSGFPRDHDHIHPADHGPLWAYASLAGLMAAAFVVACAAILAPWIGMRAAITVGGMLLALCTVLEVMFLYGWLSSRSREAALNILVPGALGLAVVGLLICALLQARGMSRRLKQADNLRSFQIQQVIDNQFNPDRLRRPLFVRPDGSPLGGSTPPDTEGRLAP